MKKYLSLLFISVLAVSLYVSCKKDKTQVQGTAPGNAAYLKIIHAAPGFAQVFNSTDNFNILINGKRIAAGITYNGAFPVNTTNVDTYAAVPAGAQDIRIVAKGSATVDSITLATIPKSLATGNYYTLVITDSITTTPDYSKIWIVDNLPANPIGNNYAIRFIHAVMNDTAGKKVDVYSFRNAANIFSNVSPGDVTAFNSLAYPASADTLSIRRAGTTFELAKVTSVGLTNNQRVYTLVYRGDGRLTSGTKARGGYVYNNR